MEELKNIVQLIISGKVGENGVGSDGLTRRDFLRLMGASMALAGFSGCRRPIEKIVPYLSQPEEVILGLLNYYATSMPFGLDAFGLMVENHEGRPTKIEGNKLHPSTSGGSNPYLQASILNLYDPDRLKGVYFNGELKSWAKFVEYWREIFASHSVSKGLGLAMLAGSFSSPTLFQLKSEFMRRFPQAQWITYDAVNDNNIFQGIETAFGSRLKPVYHFNKADYILSLDSDFLYLESNNVANAYKFAEGRRLNSSHDKINHLCVVESDYSVTGAAADTRIPLASSNIYDYVIYLAHKLKTAGIDVGFDPKPVNLENLPVEKVDSIVNDLVRTRGKNIILAGRNQPPQVHALVSAINYALENCGETVDYIEMQDVSLTNKNKLISLADRINSGEISTLVMVGCNPVYSSPVDIDLKSALNKVQHKIYLSDYRDETSEAADWLIPRVHFLESWSDARSWDGIPGVVQPQIQPLYGGKSECEFFNLITTGKDERGYDVVRTTWKKFLGNNDFEAKWRKVLHDGLYPDGKMKPASVKLSVNDVNNSISGISGPVVDGYELVFRPDYKVYDGRFTNNAWLQELPDPITKLVWDNAALVSVGTAKELNSKNGDFIEIKYKENRLKIPVWIVPGHADDSVTIPMGYGRSKAGRVGNNTGFNAFKLLTSDGGNIISGVSIEKTGGKYPLASTQDHSKMEGRPLVRTASIKQYRGYSHFAGEMVHIPNLHSLWKEHKYDTGYQWGMTIDLNLCTGCGACTIACQAENNIPVVGKHEAGYGREMHWMRIDRYFGDDEHNPRILVQPVACQQCEMAPCEQVCPVAATNHDEEGLNLMTYNRCVGTRYCSNNCPYKVRRFNFFNYTKKMFESLKMAQNPDVTVRSRGVMEKCNYCLQRINRAKINAKNHGRRVKDGEIVTACQQACPTGAIKFGNLLDPESEVAKSVQNERSYAILAEFNTRPRTIYLARIFNTDDDGAEKRHHG